MAYKLSHITKVGIHRISENPHCSSVFFCFSRLFTPFLSFFSISGKEAPSYGISHQKAA